MMLPRSWESVKHGGDPEVCVRGAECVQGPVVAVAGKTVWIKGQKVLNTKQRSVENLG